MYARETEVVQSINDPSIRENSTYLKVRFPEHTLPIFLSCWDGETHGHEIFACAAIPLSAAGRALLHQC